MPLAATLKVTVVPTGAAPKGASRSELRFAREGDLWRGRVIVDV